MWKSCTLIVLLAAGCLTPAPPPTGQPRAETPLDLVQLTLACPDGGRPEEVGGACSKIWWHPTAAIGIRDAAVDPTGIIVLAGFDQDFSRPPSVAGEGAAVLAAKAAIMVTHDGGHTFDIRHVAALSPPGPTLEADATVWAVTFDAQGNLWVGGYVTPYPPPVIGGNIVESPSASGFVFVTMTRDLGLSWEMPVYWSQPRFFGMDFFTLGGMRALLVGDGASTSVHVLSGAQGWDVQRLTWPCIIPSNGVRVTNGTLFACEGQAGEGIATFLLRDDGELLDRSDIPYTRGPRPLPKVIAIEGGLLFNDSENGEGRYAVTWNEGMDWEERRLPVNQSRLLAGYTDYVGAKTVDAWQGGAFFVVEGWPPHADEVEATGATGHQPRIVAMIVDKNGHLVDEALLRETDKPVEGPFARGLHGFATGGGTLVGAAATDGGGPLCYAVAFFEVRCTKISANPSEA